MTNPDEIENYEAPPPQYSQAVGTVRILYGMPIIFCSDGLWRNEFGTVIGLTEPKWSRDDTARAGVGAVSLSPTDEISVLSHPHDYQTMSPAYQHFHSMAQAHADWLRMQEFGTRKDWWSRLKLWVCKKLLPAAQGGFWDNEKTMFRE